MNYVPGQWEAECDRCGFRYKSGQLRKEWTGLRTCSGPGTADCWEPRHPQDYVRGVRDAQAPAWVRPSKEAPVSAVITNATQANPVVITHDGSRSFSNGATVWIEDVEGMTEINRRRFTVASATATTFALQGEDGTGHTAYSEGGRASVDVQASDL